MALCYFPTKKWQHKTCVWKKDSRPFAYLKDKCFGKILNLEMFRKACLIVSHSLKVFISEEYETIVRSMLNVNTKVISRTNRFFSFTYEAFSRFLLRQRTPPQPPFLKSFFFFLPYIYFLSYLNVRTLATLLMVQCNITVMLTAYVNVILVCHIIDLRIKLSLGCVWAYYRQKQSS